jgi:hypothetical protein
MPIIPGRLRQEDHKFQANLGYKSNHFFKKHSLTLLIKLPVTKTSLEDWGKQGIVM